MFSDREIEEIRKQCTGFLHGHYPVDPKKYFLEMSEITKTSEKRDHYGVGEGLKSFENTLSKMFGKEDCIFLQSGTAAQLIAMRIWSEKKGNSLIAFHSTCHLELHEHKAYKELHGLDSQFIGTEDKLLTLDDLKSLGKDPSAVILELPQREIGGQLPEWEDLKKQIEYLRSKNIKVHLDGARVWEASVYYNKSYQAIGELFDSIYISFYKGIGAIAGAALLGPCDFISEGRIWNRRHGGNLITLSPFYLSAQHNLNKRINLFGAYYKKTLEIAKIVSEIDGAQLLPEVPQVNMFHLLIKGDQKKLTLRGMTISQKRHIWGLTHWQVGDDGHCKLEWYVGDATMDIPIETIKEMILEIAG